MRTIGLAGQKYSLIRSGLSVVLIVLLTLLPVLSSCSKDKPSEPSQIEPPVETSTSEGTVNVSEIGGEGLEVLSAWDDEQPVELSGAFNVTVSIEGTQLLMLQDSIGDLRGLALSIPSSSKNGFQSLEINAASTLESILMMTPGILTIDPVETQQRLAELRGLAEYQSLLSSFQQNLISESVSELLQKPEVQQSLQNCIQAWSDSRGKEFKSNRFNIGYGGFSAVVLDQSNLQETKIQLTNEAWRFLKVQRRDLNSEGQELQVSNVAKDLYCMRGAAPVSWGTLFTWTIGNPTIKQDTVDFSSSSEIFKAEYWGLGVGLKPGEFELPTTLDSDYDEAVLLTYIWYVAFPTIDIVLGAEYLFEKGSEGVRLAYNVLSGTLDFSEIMNATSKEEALAASIDLTYQIISILSKAKVLGISALAWKVILAATAVMQVFNVVLAVNSWYNVPSVCMSQARVEYPSDYPVKDDFEDGVIDSDLWITGGEKRGWSESDPPGQGDWTYFVDEIIATDGYLQMKVEGPTSGLTYGAEAWVQTTYNFNDGSDHLLNFVWEADVVIGDHYDYYFIQITDGYIPYNGSVHWPTNQFPDGTANLLWRETTGGDPAPGASLTSGLSKTNWSLQILSDGIARLYDGPNATDSLVHEEMLDSGYEWYVRFMVIDATSTGFPAGDDRFNLFDFSATVINK